MTTVAALALVTGDRPASMLRADVIDGPYARLLAESDDLGPARSGVVQLTADLYGETEPIRLETWAQHHGLTVSWRTGDDWAVIAGTPKAVAEAFGVAVRDYRAVDGPDAGRVFYASPQQPGIPAETRGEATPEQLEQAWYEELAKLQEADLPERELRKVKNRVAAQNYRKLENNMSLLIQLAFAEAVLDWREINDGPAKYEAVTAADIRRVANRYFAPTNRSVATYRRASK